MSKLITQTLIGAVDWLRNSPSNWKESAYIDLKNILSRIYPTVMPEPIKKGIDFENVVNQLVLSKTIPENVSPELGQVLSLCMNSTIQKVSKSIIKLDSKLYKDDICLYGKIDYAFPSILKDLKVTKEFKSPAKYLNTMQHLIYCYNEKINAFQYVIVVMEESSTKIKSVHTIDYTVNNMDMVFQTIRDKIVNVYDFLSADEELWSLYNEKFCLYNDTVSTLKFTDIRNVEDITGKLAKDFDYRLTTTGKQLAKSSICISIAGAEHFVNLLVWGELAEDLARTYKKGDAVSFNGYFKENEWNGKVTIEFTIKKDKDY